MDQLTDNRDEQLDLEYLKILRLMKPYITCIMNNDYVQLIRLWLEKISNQNFANKEDRNKYLKQLGKQIEDGILNVPFIEEPPEDALPLYDELLLSSKQKSEGIKEIKSAPQYGTQQINVSKKYTSEPIAFKEQDKMCREKCDTIKDKMERIEKYSRRIEYEPPNSCMRNKNKRKRAMNISQKINYNSLNCLSSEYNQHMIARYDDIKTRPLNDGYDNSFSNENSWMDLTECSTTNITEWGSGDKEFTDPRYLNTNMNRLKDFYELKISNLLSIIEEIKEENLLLKEAIAVKDNELQKRNIKAETSINDLNNEINVLKVRLQELMDMKVALQSSHYAVASEWQKHIQDLERKMYTLQKENTELQMTVAVLDKKLNLSLEEKEKKTNTIKMKMSNIHDKETALLRELNRKTEAHLKKQIIEQGAVKEKEYFERLRETTDNYESKLNEMEVEFRDLLENKQKENDRLQNVIIDLENRMKLKEDELTISGNVENGTEKIHYLQKCVMKMDKIYHKAEKAYTKQIQKLRKEIEYKDRTLHIQLSGQKAELVAQSTRFRQIEIDSIVNKLEDNYKLMLRQQQAEALTAKEEYEKYIQLLKDELDVYKYNK